MYLKMSNYGSSLSNRLKCRSIINSIKGELISCDKLTVDFKDVSFITASFGTELFDSIFGCMENENVSIVNIEDDAKSIISFCLRNVKQKELA